MAGEGFQEVPGMANLINATQDAARQYQEEAPAQRQPQSQPRRQPDPPPRYRDDVPRETRDMREQRDPRSSINEIDGQFRGPKQQPESVQRRFDELTKEKYEYKELAQKALTTVNQLQGKLQNIEAQIQGLSSAKQNENEFTKYSDKELRGMEIQALDHNGNHFSPALASTIRDEITRRELDRREQRYTGERLAQSKLQAQAAIAQQETLMALPPELRAQIEQKRGDFFDRAREFFAESKQFDNFGRPDFEHERSAILRALNDHYSRNYGNGNGNGHTPANRNGAGYDQGDLKRRESYASMGDSIVDEAITPRALFAQGKVDEGINAMAGVQHMMKQVEDIARFSR